MPQQGITFDGQYIGLPGAYYGDDVSGAGPNTPPTTPPLLFLGYGWGPKPKTAVTFTNPGDLLAALRGAPAAAFVPFIANPSPQLNGAQLVTFIDVSSNTQSALALLASGGGTQTLLTSTLYGPPSNQLTAQVETGSVAGLKVVLTDNYAAQQVVGDNLTVPFQLAYSGAGTVTYSVAASAFAITSSISSESVTVPLGSGSYATVASLVNYLNGTGHYFAQGLSSTGGQLPSTSLTATGGVSLPVPVGSVAQYVNVRAYLQDIAFWVNQFASTLATATVSGSATDIAAWLPVTGTPSFFSGATGVPPTNNDYASGLTVALATPGWTVFCDSNAAAVTALLAAHVEIASTAPYGMWRRGFTGSSIGDSVATTQTNAIDLDSLQMNYSYPGIYRINTGTGANQLYGGLYVAAAAAGIATGNQIAQPLTNKVLNGTGVEQVNAGSPLTSSQMVALQNSGVQVLFVPQQTGVPTILSDVTTWQIDDNVENTSSQQVACRYWLAYSMVSALRPYVGTIASPTTEVTILNAAKRMLNALIYTGGASNGVLASWDTGSLVLVYNGTDQVAGVTFNATLVGQNRYITCFATITPLSFTISAA